MNKPSVWSDVAQDDDIPLPLHVAAKWDFRLGYVKNDGGYWYAIRDWIAGLTGTAFARDTWQQLRRTEEMKPVLDYVRVYPYRMSNGRTAMVQHTDDNGLYLIAANLRITKKRTALPAIKEYLAKAGVLVDTLRRDPKARAELGATAGPELVIEAAIDHYDKAGQPESWIEARLQGIVTRKAFTSALKAAILDMPDSVYARSTEKLYSGLWKRTTAQLRSDLGIGKKANLRDNFGEYALIYTRLAEKVATDKLKDAEIVPEKVAMDIVYEAAKLIHTQAQATSKALGIDLVTDRPLLPDKHS